MWVWSYPSIDPAFRDLLMKKCTLVDGNETEETPALEYSFGHYAEAWFYMLNQNANEISKVRLNTAIHAWFDDKFLVCYSLVYYR